MIKHFSFCILLFFIIFSQSNSYSQDSTLVDSLVVDSIDVETPIQADTITVIGVGDIMLGTNFPSKIYLPPNSECEPLLADVKDVLQSADITFGNLEGCISDSAPLAKNCKDTTKCYAFRMPEKFANCFAYAGFDMVSLANNHSGDFGDEGRNKTMELLDSLSIAYAGLVGNEVCYVEKDSMIFGLAAFSPNKGTVLIHDSLYAKKLVQQLNDSADIVIVSFHGGAEGAKYERVTRELEEFYGENRGNVYEFAHAMIDAGADIVFGHGPHVTRAIELYNNKFIAYSLGNFCTYGRFNLSGPNGFAPLIIVHMDYDGQIMAAKIIPVYQNNSGHVRKDPSKRAIFKIRELTNSDFPDSGVEIDNDGNILFKP